MNSYYTPFKNQYYSPKRHLTSPTTAASEKHFSGSQSKNIFKGVRSSLNSMIGEAANKK